MIAGRSFAVFSVAFAVAYAVIYVIAIEYNLALFTYHPASGSFTGWSSRRQISRRCTGTAGC
jgi:hypothetical protein